MMSLSAASKSDMHTCRTVSDGRVRSSATSRGLGAAAAAATADAPCPLLPPAPAAWRDLAPAAAGLLQRLLLSLLLVVAGTVGSSPAV